MSCDHVSHKPKPVFERDPIFVELLGEYTRAGKAKGFPWIYSVKPSGTVRFLSGTSTGIHPY